MSLSVSNAIITFSLDEIEEEEAEPKLKRKKAPLDKKSSMVQVTPAMKRMAKEHSDDF